MLFTVHIDNHPQLRSTLLRMSAGSPTTLALLVFHPRTIVCYTHDSEKGLHHVLSLKCATDSWIDPGKTLGSACVYIKDLEEAIQTTHLLLFVERGKRDGLCTRFRLNGKIIVSVDDHKTHRAMCCNYRLFKSMAKPCLRQRMKFQPKLLLHARRKIHRIAPKHALRFASDRMHVGKAVVASTTPSSLNKELQVPKQFLYTILPRPCPPWRAGARCLHKWERDQMYRDTWSEMSIGCSEKAIEATFTQPTGALRTYAVLSLL